MSVKTQTFVLKMPRRVNVEIPAGMKIINPGQPRLASTGDVKIVTAAVHDGASYLSAQTMLERAASESPIDSVQDLEEVLTRGLNLDCDYLLTNIRLRDSRSCGCVLYLYRNDDEWIVDFRLLRNDFDDRFQVLCLGK